MPDNIGTITGPEGIRVVVRTGDPPTERRTTRYAAALRRQAANRARRVQGKPALAAIAPGPCSQCGGYGVRSKYRLPCDACGGTGG